MNDSNSSQTRYDSYGLGLHIRIWMLVVGLVPLLVLFIYGYLAAQGALIKASDEHLLSVVGARQAQIQVWLQERFTDLEVISGSQDCINLVLRSTSHQHHAAVCQYLDSFQTSARDYRVLALYNLDWAWVASHTGGEEHTEPIFDENLQRDLTTSLGPVMSPVHPHDAMGVGLHIANTLREPGGPTLGYVVAVLDLTGTFAPILRNRADLGETGSVYLADINGEILVAGDPNLVPNQLDPSILAEARMAERGALHVEGPDGITRFTAFMTIQNPGWILVADMHEAEALGLLDALRRGFLIAGLATLAAVIVLSSRTSRRLSAPLDELAQAARRIAQGNPHDRVPTLAGREVAEVGEAFNEMLDALEDINRQRVQADTLAAVGELSSNMVHEIRNRLSSVKMNVQALGQKVGDDPTHGELARIALEQVQRTEETVTDLLSYARPVTLSPGPVVHRDLLDALRMQFQAEAAERGVEISLEIDGSDLVLQADAKLLEQALANLIRNGLEAAPRGGHICLRATQSSGPGWIVLEVEDDGPGFPGIPSDDLFRPFFTTKDRGAGLGLAHARKIAEIHAGRIGARNAETDGAVFHIDLPVKENS